MAIDEIEVGRKGKERKGGFRWKIDGNENNDGSWNEDRNLKNRRGDSGGAYLRT
jgi:hypothetical protein